MIDRKEAKPGAGPFVELPGGVAINPLVKVQSIYEDGLEHSVVRFYAFVEAVCAAKRINHNYQEII